MANKRGVEMLAIFRANRNIHKTIQNRKSEGGRMGLRVGGARNQQRLAA